MYIGREYLRVSSDKSKRARSTDEQHAENVRAAERQGVTLGEPYIDVDRSASRHATKEREDFGQLMADLRADRFRADFLWLWESSRGSRRVSEWVELLELLEQRGVRVFVTTHGRQYDPRNPRDRRSLLEDAVDSEYESGKTSERVVRGLAANAAAGKPHGKAPYGLLRHVRPDGSTSWVIDEERAAVVRELFARIRAGHTLRSITLDFAARGVLNQSGRPFSIAHLRDMLTKAAYAGLRVHHGVTSPGTWPAIVPLADYHAVQAMLTDPARQKRKPGRASHLLSMIARCEPCGSVLTAVQGAYRCLGGGHVQVPEADLDAAGRLAIVAYLSRRDVLDAIMAAADQADDRLKVVRDQLAEVRAEHRALANADISIALAAAKEPPILKRIEELETAERQLSLPGVLQGLVDGADVADWFDAMPVAAKREVARFVLSADRLGALLVRRSPIRRRPAPIGDRIEFQAEGR